MNNPIMNSYRALKKTSGVVIVSVFAMLHSVSGLAQESSELECGTQTTSIYFGNGINTTRASAELSKMRIERSYKTELQNQYPGQAFEFKLAYNQTYGFTADVTEVFLQTASTENRELFAQLGSSQLYELMSTSQDRFNEVADRIQARFRDVVTGNTFIELLSIDNRDGLRQDIIDGIGTSLASGVFAAGVLQADTNETLTQLYRNDLDVGQRVLVIAHSQGNLFARDNINAVISSNPEYATSIGSVGVATPANMQPNGGSYLTANDDLVIDALRVQTAIDGIDGNEPAPSNWDNDPGVFNDPRGFLNHNFLSAYFSSALSSRGEIDTLFNNQIASLMFPASIIGSGAIRVTLEWGSEPDVDLHAFEPDGTQVFYGNMTGSSGFLDRDDVDSFGPENYFVPCDSVQEGRYGFGVNYFTGNAPEIASLSLILSDGQTASLNIPLASASGLSGNNPPKVLSVVVARDEQGQLRYTIEESASLDEQVTESTPLTPLQLTSK
ncbi:MAG: YfaP family protein [Granulosicoccus sp.]